MMELIDELSFGGGVAGVERILLQQQRRGDRRSGGEVGEARDEAAECHRVQQFISWRTHLTMAMTTSKTIYRIGYQPLLSGIFVTPYPYAYQ